MAAPKLTEHIILAAIQGFESQKTKIDQQIDELRAMLSGRRVASTASSEAAPAISGPPLLTGKRKKFSAASRRKMALAQKARWAKFKGETEATAPEPVKAKRKMSPAARTAIGEATRQRWALKKATEAAKSAPAKKGASKKAAVKKEPAKAAKKSAPVKKVVRKAVAKKTAPVAAPAVATAAV